MMNNTSNQFKSIKKRNVGLAILFSLVTLGIYFLYWKYNLIKSVKTIKGETGGLGELLCMIFIPFYSLYWWYTRGEIVRTELSKMGCSITGRGGIFLVLSLVGLEIVAMAIMQSDFNSICSDVKMTSPNIAVKCILSLTLICAVMTALLALANYITAPVIAANESAAANEALLIVMPDGEGFTSVDISELGLSETVSEVYTEKNGGTVVKLTTTGFNPNMTIMVGVSADGTVTGATCLSSEETLGYEKTYGDSLSGTTIDTIDAVDTISGATKTTAAYKNAVRDALNAAIVVGGGEAVKSDEEIFEENLAAALPEADGFTPVFMLDEIEQIEGAYSANNGVGYVICINGKFIAADANGKVISEGATTEEKAAATSAVATICSWELSPIDLASYADMPEAITAAYKTASGNFVFDIKASGYGINGDKYIKSGEYIYIKVSATADGKIIACETVSQKESDGFGDACAKPEYYSQFNGKTADTYKEVHAISGATITSNGYMTAISRVFEAVAILNGGANNETAE